MTPSNEDTTWKLLNTGFEYEGPASVRYPRGGGSQTSITKNNENIETINGDILKLDSKDVIIADKKKPLALAGIIGGSNSHVTKDTNTILVESAIFDEVYIRRSSKKHDISTESSKTWYRSG